MPRRCELAESTGTGTGRRSLITQRTSAEKRRQLLLRVGPDGTGSSSGSGAGTVLCYFSLLYMQVNARGEVWRLTEPVPVPVP